MKMFSVYDRAVESFTPPFFQPTAAGAIRSIKNEMRNEQSQLAQHPTDFELWQLGEYDEQTGDITAKKEKINRLEDLKD